MIRRLDRCDGAIQERVDESRGTALRLLDDRAPVRLLALGTGDEDPDVLLVVDAARVWLARVA